MTIEPRTITELGARLEKFERIRPGLFHCRCPICGDSKKDPNKRRGAFVEMSIGSWMYSCLNCGERLPYMAFIHRHARDLYAKERVEGIRDAIDLNRRKPEEKVEEVFEEVIEPESTKAFLNPEKFGAIPILELTKEHKARKYLAGRKLSKRMVEDLYYVPNYGEFVHRADHQEIKSKKDGILIPWRWIDRRIFGVQARYFVGDLRYQSVKFEFDTPKVFNLDKIDPSKTVNVVEGCFDSDFLPNCIATLDSALHKRVAELAPLANSNVVLWFDDEVRMNKEIRRQKKEAVELGYAVAFYPSDFKRHGKDLNDVACKIGRHNLTELLKNVRILDGLKAKAALLGETLNIGA